MESSESSSAAFYLVFLLVLLLFSMFFSATETAFMSASRLRIRYLSEKKNKAARRVEKLLMHRDLFLNTILIGNNIVNIATTSIITSLSIRFFGDAGVGMATAITTIVILIFGEILPKSTALQRPEQLALKFSLPVSFFMMIFSPIVIVVSGLTHFLARFAGVRKTKTKKSVTEDDIKTLLEIGTETGIIESQERDMMHKIMRYTDLCAHDIMTARTDIVSVNMNASREEILALSHESRFSRFPVYGKDIDDIRGILYIKDFLFADVHENQPFLIQQLLRPALFILENQKISTIRNRLTKERQNIAVVIDEYGGTKGLLTTEDLVEEIFGGISDEYDVPENNPQIVPESAGTEKNGILLDGGERIDSVNERFFVHLDSEFYDTIGGFLMEKAGSIPEPGFSWTGQGLSFSIESIQGNRIEKIRLKRIKDEP